MQYYSLQHWILLLSPVSSTAGYCFCFGSLPSFFLELFLHSSPVSYWAPTDLGSSSFSILSFCLFIPFMGFSRQEYWNDLPFSSPVDWTLARLYSCKFLEHSKHPLPRGLCACCSLCLESSSSGICMARLLSSVRSLLRIPEQLPLTITESQIPPSSDGYSSPFCTRMWVPWGQRLFLSQQLRRIMPGAY